MEERFERYHPDMEALHRGMRTKPCFVCEIVAGVNELQQHYVYEDGKAIAFLDTYPRAYGYTLVAPKEHREQVTGDFSIEEYLDLQRVVYQVSEAVRQEVRAERMYLYTFGATRGTHTSTGTWSP
jgi:diadenosine tetraphosphate (Ap4A) HIT family hydrolase